MPQVRAHQQAILQALRGGASFFTAHKEGGTRIRFDGTQFVRADYGESDLVQRFASDAEFLDFLYRFYEAENTQSVRPASLAQAEAWRLIRRRLDPRANGLLAAPGPRWSPAVVAAVLVVLALAAVFAYLRVHPKAAALQARDAPAPLAKIPPMPSERADGKDWQKLQDEHRRAVEAARAQAKP